MKQDETPGNSATEGGQTALEGIALNAPQTEPQLWASNANYAIADSYYTAGQLATAALTAYAAAAGDNGEAG